MSNPRIQLATKAAGKSPDEVALSDAQKRKLEDERRYERRSIKERKDEEGNQEFKDKEKFITPAYKEKMEKLQKFYEHIQYVNNEYSYLTK